MFTSILIDIDGTLLDTADCFYSSLNTVLKKNHISETHDPGLFGMCVDQALEYLGLTNIAGIKEEWESLFGELSGSVAFYDNIPEMIRTLYSQGIKIVIITSRSHSTADRICSASELSPFITGCVAAEDTNEHKPSPAPLLKAIDAYGIDPEATIYIGDTNNDYLSAKSASIPFALAGWNGNIPSGNYELVFYDPMDICKYIIMQGDQV